MQPLYNTEATAWGGRDGRAATADGTVDVTLTSPKELGGPGGEGTNPEQLFAVGWAGCFHSALKLVAKQKGIDVSESAVTVRVTLNLEDNGGVALSAEIEAELPGVSAEDGQALIERTHKVCPYSKATNGNVPTKLLLTSE
jgi:lipoyl-dependent peroxiredoxin